MNVYHGTNKTSAGSIIGPPANVDVSKGKGELGQGFYTGENIALAAAWAKGRYSTSSAVLKIEIDDTAYIRFRTKVIPRREVVFRLWQSLLKRKKTHCHVFGFDVILAPFSTLDFSYQYKFESKLAENVLNHSNIQLL